MCELQTCISILTLPNNKDGWNTVLFCFLKGWLKTGAWAGWPFSKVGNSILLGTQSTHTTPKENRWEFKVLHQQWSRLWPAGRYLTAHAFRLTYVSSIINSFIPKRRCCKGKQSSCLTWAHLRTQTLLWAPSLCHTASSSEWPFYIFLVFLQN